MSVYVKINNVAKKIEALSKTNKGHFGAYFNENDLYNTIRDKILEEGLVVSFDCKFIQTGIFSLEDKTMQEYTTTTKNVTNKWVEGKAMKDVDETVTVTNQLPVKRQYFLAQLTFTWTDIEDNSQTSDTVLELIEPDNRTTLEQSIGKSETYRFRTYYQKKFMLPTDAPDPDSAEGKAITYNKNPGQFDNELTALYDELVALKPDHQFVVELNSKFKTEYSRLAVQAKDVRAFLALYAYKMKNYAEPIRERLIKALEEVNNGK